MQPQPLKSLSEHLLRAGVAHRHVRRYVRELHEHYEDAVREELAKGLDRSLAEQTAWARLGNEEELARSVLAQPTLRSTAARFPVLVFGAAPALIWLTSLALSLFAFGVFAESYERPAPPFWVLELDYALLLLYMRVLPVVLGVLLVIASARQRLTPYWPIIGTAIVAFIAGTSSITLILASTPEASSVGVASSLLPLILPSSAALGPPNALAFAGGLARAALMVGIAATPYVIWRIQQRRANTVIS
ncbi:MAG: hypothetical protein ACJ8R9_30520 [Steroidobacteraceae bacterium]